ncbi:glycosyltransferase family 39 protein [bacterium]|nr:glycosyltransferase family 39 protein [bacterium]
MQIKNHYKLLAIFLSLTFVFVAFLSVEGFNWNNLKYTGDAITSDELSHISAGYYYLKTGRYFINPEHPPLIKDISALPLLFLNPTFPKISDEVNFKSEYTRWQYPLKSYEFPKKLEVGNSQWDWGRVFLFHPDNSPDVITFWARLSVIVFNAIFLFLLFILLLKIWSKRASLMGLFLIVISQLNIAQGSLVVMDFMSSILQMVAIVCFAIYLKKYVEKKVNLSWFLLMVLFFSLALLSKFSSIIIIPATFISGLIYIAFIQKSWKKIGKYIVRYASLVTAVFLVISAFYAFHVFNMSDNEMISQTVSIYPEKFPSIGAEVLVAFIINNPLTKGLVEYVNGVIMVFGRIAGAWQSTYFMGKVYGSEGAGPLYFLILYLTKLSIGLLALNFIGLLFVVWNFFTRKNNLKKKFLLFIENPLSFFLLVFSYLYLVVTLSSNLQIGLRHILPVIIAITLLTAKAMDTHWNKKLLNILKIKYVFSGLAIVILISTLLSFPHYLSYYNYFEGGTDKGYMIATDSNYDWGGQDVKRLAKWAKDNNIEKIYAGIFTNVPLEYYLGEGYEPYKIEWGWIPSDSYIAISVFEYQNNVYNDKLADDKKYTLIDDYFIEKVGKTMLIFKTP